MRARKSSCSKSSVFMQLEVPPPRPSYLGNDIQLSDNPLTWNKLDEALRGAHFVYTIEPLALRQNDNLQKEEDGQRHPQKCLWLVLCIIYPDERKLDVEYGKVHAQAQQLLLPGISLQLKS